MAADPKEDTSRGDRMTAKYFVLACGRQSLPKLPGIPGIEDYRGKALLLFFWATW